MHKKAIIFDLDNTIYSVYSIGDELFAPLLTLIHNSGEHSRDMDEIKDHIMRRPFQLVAKDFHFSEALTSAGTALLKDTAYNGKIEPFDDYRFARQLPLDKFLVTTGFLKLQQSKVKGMKLEGDFKEIHIIDPLASVKTKKDVFADIMERHGYAKSALLVVGDDLHSEIKAAQDLEIDAVLYDKAGRSRNGITVPKISDFKQLEAFLF